MYVRRRPFGGSVGMVGMVPRCFDVLMVFVGFWISFRTYYIVLLIVTISELHVLSLKCRSVADREISDAHGDEPSGTAV